MKTARSFEIVMMIKEIYGVMNSHMSCSMKGSGLTPQQTMIIKLVAHHGEVTMSTLCQEMSLAKATVSGIVQRLEEAGYIRKLKKDQDKRNTYIVFSDKGNKFASEFRETMNHSFEDLFENLTDDEIMQVKASLKLLANRIKGDEI
ncbi:MAG: MarR family winged helix-turn-helix transcriptional regulator [Cellulosilyticaceae bacterium]